MHGVLPQRNLEKKMCRLPFSVTIAVMNGRNHCWVERARKLSAQMMEKGLQIAIDERLAVEIELHTALDSTISSFFFTFLLKSGTPLLLLLRIHFHFLRKSRNNHVLFLFNSCDQVIHSYDRAPHLSRISYSQLLRFTLQA